MYIIVGLGNPERRYDGTRHNIGFSAVTALADIYGISMDMKKHRAVCGKGVIDGQKVILAMPQTYMNLSGESVRELVDYYKIDPEEELIVIYDVIAHLGTQVFPRIRIGVGEKPKGWDLADYVLGRFSKEEEPVVREALEKAAKACSEIITEDVTSAMNKYNNK